MRNLLKSERGVNLVELVLATAVLSIVGIGGLLAINGLIKSKSQVQSGEALTRFRGNLIESLNSSASWRETLAHPQNLSSLSCLRSLTDCSGYSTNWTDITVVNARREVLVDASNPSFGFRPSGDTCPDFNPSGNDACPLKYSIQWRAICGPTNCVNPQVQIRGQLQYAPGINAAVINKNRYSINLIRGQVTNTLEDACLSANGIFDAVTRTCRMPMVGLCPPGMVVIGVDPETLDKRCGHLFVGSCPSTDASGTPMVFYGSDANGDPICYPQIASTCWTCTPGDVGCSPLPPVGTAGAAGGTDGGCGPGDGGGGGSCDGGAGDGDGDGDGDGT